MRSEQSKEGACPGLNACLRAQELGTILGGRRLTSRIPPFKMKIGVPLPWGSRGRYKSRNPVNTTRNQISYHSLNPQRRHGYLENSARRQSLHVG